MSNTNSIPPYMGGTLQETQEALGITRMSGENDWNQVLGGLILQGGLCSGSAVSFSIPFPKKLLGIFGTSSHPLATLEGFTPLEDDAGRTFYWMAIGF